MFWYQKGTDFHIKMDSDGLIMAGGGRGAGDVDGCAD